MYRRQLQRMLRGVSRVSRNRPRAVSTAYFGETLERRLLLSDVVNHPPYLQLGAAPLGAVTDQAEVIWQTSNTPIGGSFDWGYKKASDPGPITFVPPTEFASVGTAGDDRTNYVARMTNLDYDTDYQYTVRHLTGADSYTHTFHTRLAPGSTAPFSFVTYGDSADSSNPGPWRTLQTLITQNYASQAQFSLMLGDNIYPQGLHPTWDTRLAEPQWTAWASTHLEVMAIGNHDLTAQPTQTNVDAVYTEQNLSNPTNGPLNPHGRAEHNYSWDYGNVHFVVIDANIANTASWVDTGGAYHSAFDNLVSWMRTDLNGSTARWKIVAFHQPPASYTDAGAKTNPPQYYTRQLINLFNETGVDLVLNGHVHNYQRSYPLAIDGTGLHGDAAEMASHDNTYDANAPVSNTAYPDPGVVSAIVGTGGRGFEGVPSGGWVAASQTTQVGFLKLDVSDTSLNATFISSANAVLDQFSIVADHQPPVAHLDPAVDNQAGDSDLAPDRVLISTPPSSIRVLVQDMPGNAVNWNTVTDGAVMLKKDGIAIPFNFSAAPNSPPVKGAGGYITLTPSGGGTFGDGVYEITLNAPGSSPLIADTASPANVMPATTLVYEVDTNLAVTQVTTTLNGGALKIVGTRGNDNLTVTRGANNNVFVGGADTGLAAASVTSIQVIARAGDDTVNLAGVTSATFPGVTAPVTLLGGAGNDAITGSGFADTIDGNLGNDTLTPDGGNDTLVGGDGSDTYVFAGSTSQGSDVVDDAGTTGTDVLNFNALASGVALSLNSSAAQAVSSLLTLTLLQPANVENVSTNNGGSNTFADNVIGNAANNRIETFGGDDVLNGDGGNDTLLGGNGGDTYAWSGSASQGSDTVDETGTNSGNPDILDFANLASGLSFNMGSTASQAASAILTLTFTANSVGRLENATTSQIGAYADYITGNSLGNRIDTWDGADNLYGGWGNDTLYGGLGGDTMIGDNDSGSLSQQSGNDLLYGDGGNDLMYGDAKNASWTGSEPSSYGNGNDTLYGGLGDDIMQGDAKISNTMHDGDDFLYGEDDNDTIWGDGGSDYDPTDNAYAGYGDDLLDGGKGGDTLRGQKGNDRYQWASSQLGPLSQTDTLIEYVYGGYGDLLDFTAVTQAVTIDLSNTAATQNVVASLLVLALPTSSALYIEHVNGGSGNDTITGNSSANTLKGNDGDDVLNGGVGNDRLEGGNGNDALTGGANDDALLGGAGNDTYYFAGSTSLGSDTITEAPTADSDTINLASLLGSGATLYLWKATAQPVSSLLTLTLGDITAIENAVGTGSNDLLEGNALNNALSGGNGDDYLIAYEGNDDINGDAGNDHCYGGVGDDIVRGGTGADDLYGQEDNDVIYAVNNAADSGDLDGIDILHGGPGTNSFFYRTGEDTPLDP